MEYRTTISLRMELINALDEQIQMLATKTFSAFTREERETFEGQQQRIRELEQQIASLGPPQPVENSVFSFGYSS